MKPCVSVEVIHVNGHCSAELKRANKGIKQLRRALDDVQRGLSDRRNQLHELSIEVCGLFSSAIRLVTRFLDRHINYNSSR